ncbi:MAG: 50S ribosomal protein L18 [Candidatus Marinimicrobia bacterium]|jgi:large subunit ribosomal protein L18|nr:50S ribosomal protein L18 [Candidatus Neomarinimicrobiota bacterium]MBT3840250.1 50S ribosomal protein L18 [Candidatus Neomarinimicrobiota bacterium]MBT4000258.1 50S ribosomal protein L18 [Candidatus Neomarinimicrobiota bacterium]MBT4281807.1 50S ribosomal protein L18 [Candidatus Neomarinimicrobiota bacterium]MBT4580233.1 50S ribosomal protein L18 [Candidatus Neomarinimicrobiota bacterium]
MAKHRSIARRNERRRNRSKKTSRLHPGRPRLVVYRSLKHFEAQIINDFEGQTLASASSRDKDIKSAIKKAENKTDISRIVGGALANKAKSNKIGPVVFDRNGYPYHGRVKAFAEAARKGGLEF